MSPTGFQQVLEELSGGTVQNRYTYGTVAVSQTHLSGASEQTSYYGYDAAGDVVFLADSNGAITDEYTYDGFGNLIASVGSTVNHRGYRGELEDPDLGFVNLRARQYRPKTGRFVTADPIKGDLLMPASLNRYGYANGDPVTNGDPLGLSAGALGLPRVPNEYIALAAAIVGTLVIEKTIQLGTDGKTRTVVNGVIEEAGAQVACSFNVVLETAFGGGVGLPYQLCRRKLDLVKRVRRKGETFVVPDTSDCPPGLKNEMQKAVTEFCKNGARTCDGLSAPQDCAEIKSRLTQNWQCAMSRDRINEQCYGGGDRGHQIARDEALKAIYKCEAARVGCQ